MNKGFNIQTLKMLSNQYNQNTTIYNYQNDQENQNMTQIMTQNIDKQEYFNDIDYNFCQVYYETNDKSLINRLVTLNGIKSMKLLDAKLPNNFNWKAYGKYCQGIENEILVKKHYLESYYRKLEADQILNIIIVKKTKSPIETIILDFNNMKVTISVISEEKETIEHYNVIKYIANNGLTQKLNEVIINNTSKYYMIIFDNYSFEYNFVNKICKELDNLLTIESLLLVSDVNLEATSDLKMIEYFKINTNYLRTLSEPYICILNNSLKSEYIYSITDIGLILYINQQLKKYQNTLTSIDYKFKITESEHNKQLLRDTLNLFDMYISNIEDNILDNDINKIIELSNDENLEIISSVNNIHIDQVTSSLVKSAEYIETNEEVIKMDKIKNIAESSNNKEIIKKTKHNSGIELDFLLRENSNILNV
jgi:hypothetical protein